jgi:hypothetical protein
MPIRVKDGDVGAGVWRGPIADGNIRLKWGGTTWKSPAYIRVKNGDVGSGAWVDTGYRGYPNEPSGVSVNTWDNTAFNDLTIKWSAPAAGGAPVAAYEVRKNNASNQEVTTFTDTTSPSSAFTMSPNEKAQFYVRSKSAAGLFSDWVGPVRVLMGHPEEGHYRTENRTRSWYREVNGPWYRDAYTGGETVIKVPSDVVIKKFHYDLRAQGGFTSILSPYGSREVKMVVFSNDYNTMNMGSPYVTVDGGYSHQGDGSWWGLRCRGEGWSSTAGGPYKMLGTFGITGTETYQVQVYVVDVAYKSNGYW